MTTIETRKPRWTQDKFDKLATETRLAENAFSSFCIAMECKYGDRSPTYWNTKDVSQRNKLHARYDKFYNRLIDAIRAVSPRSWETGIPCYWIVQNINWDMATTRGNVTPIPPASWGSTTDNTLWAMPLN